MMGFSRLRTGNMKPYGYDPNAEPPAPKSFAPYPVWMTLRWITMAGSALAIVWLIWAVAALISAADGGQMPMLPVWLFVVAITVGGAPRGDNIFTGFDLPPFGEFIGRKLANKQCPSCGQSIFDHSPPSGYAPDRVTTSWWPSRFCMRCGHDMRVRTAS